MNRVPADDDTQRDLERRALANVGWLARKLGYQDSLDRRSERKLVAVIAAVLVLLVVAIVMNGIAKSGQEEKELAQHRCEMATYVELVGEQERIVRLQGRQMTEQELGLARRGSSELAHERCAAR